MNAENPRSDLDAIHDLLCEQVERELTPAESAELERLLALHPAVDREELERVAAAIELSLGAPVFEPLPPALRGKLLADARRWAAETNSGQGAAELIRAAGGVGPRVARPADLVHKARADRGGRGWSRRPVC